MPNFKNRILIVSAIYLGLAIRNAYKQNQIPKEVIILNKEEVSLED